MWREYRKWEGVELGNNVGGGGGEGSVGDERRDRSTARIRIEVDKDGTRTNGLDRSLWRVGSCNGRQLGHEKGEMVREKKVDAGHLPDR